ncbi:helix-turn-helix domain-containing protein [Ottowia thiooxydans]|uniref:DNA-binding CsgD family transcriptional regulator n=1 Tax=Ottowia thiooxydans TaxID=219182 RepID=A0ABV2Q8X9_9BURK
MDIWIAESRDSNAQVPVPCIESLARSLGEPACSRATLEALNHFARVDHCALLVRLQRTELRLLGTASQVAHANGARAALRYMDGMHLHDFADELSLVPKGGCAAPVRLSYRTRDEVVNPKYRIACYEHTGIEDRLTMSRQHGDGTVALLRCYRDESTGRFTPSELEALTAGAALLLSFVEIHAKLTLPHHIPLAHWREALDHNIDAPLSAREIDVCSNLLSGRTLADTGTELGLSVNTVITYSRRAYAKFGVGSVRQLHELLTRGNRTTEMSGSVRVRRQSLM